MTTVQNPTMSACPACRHDNPEDIKLCLACGSPLVTRCPSCGAINARTRVRCHHCAARLGEGQAGGPDVDQPPPPQLPTLTEAAEVDADVEFRLRELPPLPPVPAAVAAALARPRPLPALKLTEFEPRPLPVTVPKPAADDGSLAQAASASDPPPADPAVPLDDAALTAAGRAGFAERKAQTRAAVRRAVQRQLARQAGLASRNQVLLLEPDADRRAQMTSLLAGFGFDVQAAGTLADATRLAEQCSFVACFIAPADELARAAALCVRLRSLPQANGRPLAVLAMLDPRRHADRVRMELAGVDEVLPLPVQRGRVAKALVESGVPLPQDPRAKGRSA